MVLCFEIFVIFGGGGSKVSPSVLPRVTQRYPEVLLCTAQRYLSHHLSLLLGEGEEALPFIQCHLRIHCPCPWSLILPFSYLLKGHPQYLQIYG